MIESKYNYLFPYELIPVGSKILIYGAGELGQDYLTQMEMTHYCNVVAMVDKNYDKYPKMIVPVISPEEIHNMKFDYVVIALRVAVGINEIKRILKSQGVLEEKIICIFERKNDDIEIIDQNQGNDICPDFDLTEDIYFAFLITGGLGDHVIQKKLLTEIIKLAPHTNIDIYAIRHGEFLRYLYLDCSQVKNVYEDFGTRYNSRKNKYTVGITVEACHFLKVDEYKRDLLKDIYPGLTQSLDNLINEISWEGISLKIPVHVSNQIRLYRGLNAYTGFSYNNSFDIKDKNVNIPLTATGEAFLKELGIGKYITVNFGSGECKDSSKVAKMWPLEYFETTLRLIKARFPEITIVQLGEKDAPKMKHADIRILGEDIENVVSVLNKSMFHLDIEGGLVHIASQLGTKCVVLFGPTVERYYGYENNVNIHAGNCHECWGLFSDVNRCARHMDKPECMYSITPDIVMNEIIKEFGDYLD